MIHHPVKRYPILAAITLLPLLGLFPTQCKKFDVSQKVIVGTSGVSEITFTTTRVSGILFDTGPSGVTQHGFGWASLPETGAIANWAQLGPTGTSGVFSYLMEGLSPGGKYYVWAFGENDEGRVFGEMLEFTTMAANVPSVETGTPEIQSPTSITCPYVVTDDGGIPILQRGLCYDTLAGPTVEGPHTEEGQGTGEFTGGITGLIPGKVYYVKAYAVNEAGLGYGTERMFETPHEGNLPELETRPIAEITHFSAFAGGALLNDGGLEITAKGVCLGPDPEPTVDNLVFPMGTGPEPWQDVITGLSPDTQYFLRAFAENAAGIGYGPTEEFRTMTEPLVDERDGKEYPTVKIGEQIWMAANLNVGEKINGSINSSNDEIIQKYCYQNFDSYCDQFGALYAWDEMMQYTLVESTQGVCPDGWHIPSDEEWKVLEMTLGMSREQADEGDDTGGAERGTDEGGMLKAPGEEIWQAPNEGATNASGFSALPGGRVDNTGVYAFRGEYSYFWTSNESGNNAYYRGLSNDRATILRGRNVKDWGMSVRCVKD